MLDLENYRLVALQFPAALDGTTLTFQGSTDGTAFSNMYDDAGKEVEIEAGTSRIVALDDEDHMGAAYVRFLRFRTGTSSSPTNQGATRTLTAILK